MKMKLFFLFFVLCLQVVFCQISIPTYISETVEYNIIKERPPFWAFWRSTVYKSIENGHIGIIEDNNFYRILSATAKMEKSPVTIYKKYSKNLEIKNNIPTQVPVPGQLVANTFEYELVDKHKHYNERVKFVISGKFQEDIGNKHWVSAANKFLIVEKKFNSAMGRIKIEVNGNLKVNYILISK